MDLGGLHDLEQPLQGLYDGEPKDDTQKTSGSMSLASMRRTQCMVRRMLGILQSLSELEPARTQVVCVLKGRGMHSGFWDSRMCWDLSQLSHFVSYAHISTHI